MDLPLQFVIRESHHRIHNALVPEKLARLGAAIRPEPGWTVLDLASGSGEMLCTCAREHDVGGVGVDVSSAFTASARARADELGVTDRVAFVHGDASDYVTDEPVDVVSCLGASWIGNGAPGTLALLEPSMRPGGMALVGEPYWRSVPTTDEIARACHTESRDTWLTLPDLASSFRGLGWDLVQLVLSDPDDWDAYHGAQWLSIRRWLDANPGHELWHQMRDELDRTPTEHLAHTREHLGWGSSS